MAQLFPSVQLQRVIEDEIKKVVTSLGTGTKDLFCSGVNYNDMLLLVHSSHVAIIQRA